MNTATLNQPPAAVQGSRLKRFFLSAPMRIVLGVLAVGLTTALTFGVIKALIPSPAARFVWPYLLVTALVLLVYIGFVRLTEKRPLNELSLARAPVEFGAGLMIGGWAVALTVGLLAATGSYRIVSFNPWSASVAAPMAEMLFVGVLEEIAFRALIFRIIQRSLGNWPALLISGVIFSLAHLGGGISALGLANTFMAGLMLSAAWMITGRLWLCAGIHAAWNYVLGSIFSIAVSGHPAKGWMVGSLSGPEWVTGGVYGLEGSVWTALVLSAVFVALYQWRQRAPV